MTFPTRIPILPAPVRRSQLQLDRPGRTLVRLPHRQTHPPRQPHLHPSSRSRHPRLGRGMERRPQTVPLDQTRQTDPRVNRATSYTDLRCGTRGGWTRNLKTCANSTHPKRASLRSRAFAASTPRSFGGADVTIASSNPWVAAATAATAWAKAAPFAADGLLVPLTLRTYCRAAACTSCGVAGGA